MSGRDVGDFLEQQQPGDTVVGGGLVPFVDEVFGEAGEGVVGFVEGVLDGGSFLLCEVERLVGGATAGVGKGGEGGGDPSDGEDLAERFRLG